MTRKVSSEVDFFYQQTQNQRYGFFFICAIFKVIFNFFTDFSSCVVYIFHVIYYVVVFILFFFLSVGSGFLHCIQMDTSVNAANQVVSVGADIAFDADPKFFACLVRFESSSVPTTLPTAYDVYPLDGRHDGGYYTVKDCVTIDVLPRTPG